MTEIIITAIGAALIGGGLAGWVGFNMGREIGDSAGFVRGVASVYRLERMTAAALASGRPMRGPNGRYVKRGA